MIVDINIIYRLILIKKIKLSDEFIDNRATVKIGLIDSVITSYKEQGGYYFNQDGNLLNRVIKFLADYYE